MSYLLERESQDRIARYRREAELRRALPRSALRKRAATSLRRWADRLEAGGPSLPVEQVPIVVYGRNH